MKKYIDIKPDYTVDKSIDNSAPTAKNNSLTTLKNYIPDQGCVNTREGISEFGFISEEYNPTEDGALIWSRFESSITLIDDETQGVDFWTVTAGNTYSASGTSKEGSGSLYIDYFLLPGAGLNQGFYNEKVDLPATFPGMCDGPHNFIAAAWFQPTWRDEDTLLFRTDAPQLEGGWGIQIISAAAGAFQFRGQITNSSGSTGYITANASMWTGRWYHIALWSSTNVGDSGMIIYDALGDTEYDYSTQVPLVCGGWNTASATLRFSFGAYRSGRIYLDNLIIRVGDLTNKQSFINKIRTMRNMT